MSHLIKFDDINVINNQGRIQLQLPISEMHSDKTVGKWAIDPGHFPRSELYGLVLGAKEIDPKTEGIQSINRWRITLFFKWIFGCIGISNEFKYQTFTVQIVDPKGKCKKESFYADPGVVDGYVRNLNTWREHIHINDCTSWFGNREISIVLSTDRHTIRADDMY